MKFDRLELDHVRAAHRPAKASWLLLAIAVAFACDVGGSYFKTRAEMSERTMRLARLAGMRSSAAPASLVPASLAELTAARETILRLSMPWDNVFSALKSARSDDVVLLSIEPDPDSGSVSIAGEGKSYPAILAYVASLSQEETLKDVFLTKHEVRQNDPRRPLSFTVSAKWKEGR